MDVESCDIAAGSAKRRTPDDEGRGWDCCSLPPLKRFMAAISVSTENTGPLDSLSQENADDSFSYISDLLCHPDFHIPEKCHFSNTDFNDESITTPVSPQSDLNEFLSLLTESEAQKKFSAAENESEVVVPEMIKSTSAANTLNGEVSTGLYSGPTLTDVQSALSIFNKAEDEYASPSYSSPATTKFPSPATVFDSFDSAKLPLTRSQFGLQNMNQYDTFSQGSYRSFSSSINELFYRRLHRAKTETKYSLKVKWPGNGIDDGYKWRKYGQKAIKNSPYPRSYYRCTNPRCSAKKQVERCLEDPNTLAITYEGLHLHYSYSQLQISQQPSYSVRQQVNNIYEKEAALHGYNGIRCFDKGVGADVMAIPPSQSPRLVGGGDSGDGINVGVVEGDCGGGRRDGLLQDIVPFGIINPLSSSSTCSSASSSSP